MIAARPEICPTGRPAGPPAYSRCENLGRCPRLDDWLARWAEVQDTDGNGTNALNQNRTHKDADEITQIDASATRVAHDAAGNMTKLPNPDSWSAHYNLMWDAWNRLVKVADGANTVCHTKSRWHKACRDAPGTHLGGKVVPVAGVSICCRQCWFR